MPSLVPQAMAGQLLFEASLGLLQSYQITCFPGHSIFSRLLPSTGCYDYSLTMPTLSDLTLSDSSLSSSSYRPNMSSCSQLGLSIIILKVFDTHLFNLTHQSSLMNQLHSRHYIPKQTFPTTITHLVHMY